jgi:hypothetical protein
MVTGRRKHGDTKTCLQNNLGIFKIEGPCYYPLWSGEHFGDESHRAGSRLIARWLQSEEGHDAGGVLGQEQD